MLNSQYRVRRTSCGNLLLRFSRIFDQIAKMNSRKKELPQKYFRKKWIPLKQKPFLSFLRNNCTNNMRRCEEIVYTAYDERTSSNRSSDRTPLSNTSTIPHFFQPLRTYYTRLLLHVAVECYKPLWGEQTHMWYPYLDFDFRWTVTDFTLS